MKFKSIYMRNFCAIGETEVPLDIPGLTLISGKLYGESKADSNGASKSTLISGICYAVWGECPNGAAADEVVHNKVNKDCKVTLTLEDDDGTPIVITRTRKDSTAHKPNDLILLINGVDLSKSTVEATQLLVDNVIGMDFHTFCALMPGTGVKMASMTDKHIKSLFEKVLRTEELSKAHKLANEKYKSANRELDTLKSSLQTIKSRLIDLKIKKINYENNMNSFVADQDKAASVAKDKILECEKTLQSAHKAFQKAEKPESVVELQEKYDKERTKLAKLNEDMTEMTGKVEALKNKYTRQHASLTTELSMLSKGGDSTCATCGALLDDKHKEETKAHKEALSTKLVTYKNNYNTLLAAYNKKLATLLKSHTALSANTTSMHAKLENYSNSLVTYNLLNKSVTTATNSLYEAKAGLEEILDRKNVYKDLWVEVSQEVSTLTTAQEELSSQIQAQAESVAMLKFWVDSFAPSGIRSYMLENVAPYLNERAEYYCTLLTDGAMRVVFDTKTTQKSGKEVDKFRIEVSQANGASSWKLSSAGEKARADLVISLVLGDLATLRASKRLTWRVIDEMLDPLDESGNLAVVELLKQIARNNTSVYLITHKAHLKDLMSKEIVMAKKGGFAYLEEIKDRN